MGLSDSSSGLLSTNRHLVHILSGKAHVVTMQGLFSVPAGNKTLFLFVQPTESGRSLQSGPAHLTLIYLPTAYGTVDSD